MLYHLRSLRKFMSAKNEFKLRRAAYRLLRSPDRAQAPIVHCCAWKTGSQWARLLLSDPRFYRSTGCMPHYFSDPKGVTENPFGSRVRNGEIWLCGFLDWKTYASINKPAETKAFFVVREPRALLVSWYLSNRYSHPLNPTIEKRREEMAGMTEEEGMMYTVDIYDQVVDLVSSWTQARNSGEPIEIVRYEDLTGPDRPSHWESLLRQKLQLDISPKTIEKLLAFYRVERLAPKRKNVSKSHKYAGQGKRSTDEYFTPQVERYLESKYPDLSERFGYL